MSRNNKVLKRKWFCAFGRHREIFFASTTRLNPTDKIELH